MSSLTAKFSRSPARRVLNLMSGREQFLLAAFVIFLLVLWGVRVQEEFVRFSADLRDTQTTHARQLAYLGDEERIRREAADARARVDASKTISAAQLQGEVDSLARQAGLNFTVSSPRAQSGETFNTYTVQARIRRAGIADLITFEQALRELAPYLRVTRVQISASPSNPTELDARFDIESFDLATSST